MKNIIIKNWGHGLIWLFMIVFFIFAPPVYAKFCLKQGLPLQFKDSFPQSDTKRVKFAFDGLEPLFSGGKKIYKLKGWAFQTENPDTEQIDYERILVLRSNTNIYFFPLTTEPSGDIQEAYKDLNLELINVRFHTYIAMDFIAPGSYRLEMIFKHRTNGTSFYKKIKGIVTRTPNRLILE
jgi:hypothetical protein